MSAPDVARPSAPAVPHRRPIVAYGVAMVVLLALFAWGGDNGAVYLVALLGVPVVSGVLAGMGVILFRHAVLGCLAVVVLDLVLDETRAEDMVFFAVLAVVMVGIAALARWVTRRVVRRRARATTSTASG